MKKSLNSFSLYCEQGVVKVEGRDIWDAYQKACNKYKWVRKPYSSKRAAKWHKRQMNKAIRRNKDSHRTALKKMSQGPVSAWISVRKGVVDFD